MTQTTLQNPQGINDVLHKSLMSVNGRDLVSLTEVQDMLLDLRNALVLADQAAVLVFMDTEMKVWPKASLVASGEVTDFLLDVQHMLIV